MTGQNTNCFGDTLVYDDTRATDETFDDFMSEMRDSYKSAREGLESAFECNDHEGYGNYLDIIGELEDIAEQSGITLSNFKGFDIADLPF